MKRFFIIFLLGRLSCVHSNLLLCNEEFCDTYLEKETCKLPALCKIQNATHNGIFLPSPGPCNCCDYCLDNLDKGAPCSIGSPTTPTPTTICGPGLTCRRSLKGPSCEKKYNTKCLLAQRKYDKDRKNGDLGHLQVRPQCDRNGLYEPYMCIPGQICYCVSDNGDRIFGEIPFTPYAEHQLKCQCSRNNYQGAEIQDRNLHHIEHFRCQSNGDYDPLQCIDDECLCVDPKDGHRTNPDMKLVNMTIISTTNLPCFNNETHMEAEYYRECEALHNEEVSLIREYEREGLEVFGYTLPNCQLDGYYAPVQETSNKKYCADPSGKKLENFEVIKSSSLASSMNCYCARARSITSGIEKPECCPNGNYKTMQCRRGLCRCVDENGVQVEKEVDYEKKDTLKCAKQLCV